MGATAQSDAGGNETGGMCDVQHELVRRAPARHRRRRCDALPAPPAHRAAAPAPTQVGFLQSCGFSRLALCWLQICYQSACVRSFSKREMYVLVTPNQRFPASLTLDTQQQQQCRHCCSSCSCGTGKGTTRHAGKPAPGWVGSPGWRGLRARAGVVPAPPPAASSDWRPSGRCRYMPAPASAGLA